MDPAPFCHFPRWRGLGYPEWVRLGVEHIVIQADNIRLGEDEVEVLERLCNPEALQGKLMLVNNTLHNSPQLSATLRG